ncbi:MAG: hypothetical protein HW413_2285 [Thermoleophilia bacterium]|jgi:hypothetical protein|nr:hypothetical protein [Thermoleophilia bacterium]
MKSDWHHEDMFGVILLALLLVLGPLAVASGVDSRIDDVARRRRYNG